MRGSVLHHLGKLPWVWGALLLPLVFCRCPATRPEKFSDAAETKVDTGRKKQQLARGEDPREELKLRSYTLTVDPRGSGVLYTGTTAGLMIYNISDIHHPREIATLFLPASVTSVVPHGDLLLVSTGPEGVFVVDVGNREQPAIQAVVATRGAAMKAILTDDGFMVVADGSMGVSIFRSDGCVAGRKMGACLKSAVPVWFWDSYDTIRDISLEQERDKTYLYAAAGKEGLVLIDITSRQSPTALFTLGRIGEIRSVEMLPGRILSAAGKEGFVVVERKGSTLHLLSRFRPAVADMVRSAVGSPDGKRAFLSVGEAGMIILDISDLGSVEALGSYDHTTPINRISVSGAVLFAAADSGGLAIFDAIDATAIKLLYPK